MSLTHDFEYFKPKTLNEALDFLAQFGSKAKILAGGTDLILRIKEGFETPDALIDVKGIKELNRIELVDNVLFIGANITFSELIESEIIKDNFHLLWESSKTVASVGTRNRATITGNICSAVPSLDSGPALLVYNAEVLVKNSKGERKISIHDWFIAPKKTAIKSDEMVIGLLIHKHGKKNGTCYMKLGRYTGEDLAQAGVGILVSEENEYRIAFCAVGPIPKRFTKIEALLNGKTLNGELIKEAQLLALSEISPITDIRATKEYRNHMIQVMIERGLKTSIERLNK